MSERDSSILINFMSFLCLSIALRTFSWGFPIYFPTLVFMPFEVVAGYIGYIYGFGLFHLPILWARLYDFGDNVAPWNMVALIGFSLLALHSGGFDALTWLNQANYGISWNDTIFIISLHKYIEIFIMFTNTVRLGIIKNVLKKSFFTKLPRVKGLKLN